MKFEEFKEIRKSILEMELDLSKDQMNEFVTLWHEELSNNTINEGMSGLVTWAAIIGGAAITISTIKKYIRFKKASIAIPELIEEKYATLSKAETMKVKSKTKLDALGSDSGDKKLQKLKEKLKQQADTIDDKASAHIEDIDKKISKYEEMEMGDKAVKNLALIKSHAISTNKKKLAEARLKAAEKGSRIWKDAMATAEAMKVKIQKQEKEAEEKAKASEESKEEKAKRIEKTKEEADKLEGDDKENALKIIKAEEGKSEKKEKSSDKRKET